MSLTVSLIAVLIPLLFMGDVVGRLFREFAVTLAVTILISAVVSLTLVPMLCAQLLRRASRERASRRPHSSAGASGWFDAHDRLLRPRPDAGCSRHQALTLLVAVGTLALTVRALHRRSPRASSRSRTPA